MRKYSMLCIKIIGPWPLDPLVKLKLTQIALNFIKAKKNLFGASKSPSFLYNND